MVIAGQVPSPLLGTDAFQEVDVIGITQPITKWAYQIRRPEEIAWAVSRAFYIASTGRPGPVVLDLAKDAQVGLVDYEYQKVDYVRSYQPEPDIREERIEAAASLINNAKKAILSGRAGGYPGRSLRRTERILVEKRYTSRFYRIGLVCITFGLPIK